ncbi:hypothetical protein HYR99_26820 [Candidatus Poribacteria bacterium]|nr:hypothetical protein [Candidatus Poribacteria bacterium]
MRLQIYIALCILMVSIPGWTYAGFPESDAIFHGTVFVDNTPVSTVTVKAFKADGKTPIAEATLSDGIYVLRIPIDAGEIPLVGRKQVFSWRRFIQCDLYGVLVFPDSLDVWYHRHHHTTGMQQFRQIGCSLWECR